jgi:phosphate transport system substrate-binding protein
MNELSGVGRTGTYARLNQYLSVLTPAQARRLILKPDGPAYESAALHRIIDVTRGHPYLIQTLCHTIFEDTREHYPTKITVREVKTAVERLLERHDSGLFLIWESIPPAEQLVLAAAAERIITPNSPFSTAVLEQTLAKADISAAPEELQQAVQNLVNWQMLEQRANGYSFFIDYFRRWISRYQPLEQVKISALPQFDPQLHDLFLAAHQAYTAGDVDTAFNKIIQILAIAPSFVQAHLLLGKIHSNNRRSAQAVKSYEAAYQYNPSAAAGPLVAALVSLGVQQEQRHDLDGAMESYRRVLEIAPRNNAARTRCQALTSETNQASATKSRSSSRTGTKSSASRPPAAASSQQSTAQSARRATRRTPTRKSSRSMSRWWPVLVGVPLFLLIVLLYGLYSLLPGLLLRQHTLDSVAGEVTEPTASTIAIVSSPVPSTTVDDATGADSAALPPTATARLETRLATPTVTEGVTATPAAKTNLAAGFVAPTATPTTPTSDIPTLVTVPPTQVETSQGSGVYVTGPTELLSLFTTLAQSYGSQTPGLEIKYSTRKSTDGLAAVQQRTADVAFVARPLSTFELTQIAPVAYVLPLPQSVPVRVVVNPQLPVTNLTSSQLREIFSGAITNWSDVGGPVAPIKLVIPAESSDTGRVFQQQILGTRPLLLGENTTIAQTDAEVDPLVASQPNAIGITATQPKTDPALASVQTIQIDDAAPTSKNVTDGTYPVSRPINVVISNQLGPQARAWIDFIFSPEGERIVGETFRSDP